MSFYHALFSTFFLANLFMIEFYYPHGKEINLDTEGWTKDARLLGLGYLIGHTLWAFVQSPSPITIGIGVVVSFVTLGLYYLAFTRVGVMRMSKDATTVAVAVGMGSQYLYLYLLLSGKIPV